MSEVVNTETSAAPVQLEPVPHPLEIKEAPIPGATPDDPALNYAERTAEAAKLQNPSVEPLSDEAKMALADEIAARYVPPAPAPSIVDQINAMKEGKAPTPAPYPPENPSS